MNLVESLWIYATTVLNQNPEAWREALALDYTTPVKRDLPTYLRLPQNSENANRAPRPEVRSGVPNALPARQKQHLQSHANAPIMKS